MQLLAYSCNDEYLLPKNLDNINLFKTVYRNMNRTIYKEYLESKLKNDLLKCIKFVINYNKEKKFFEDKILRIIENNLDSILVSIKLNNKIKLPRYQFFCQKCRKIISQKNILKCENFECQKCKINCSEKTKICL